MLQALGGILGYALGRRASLVAAQAPNAQRQAMAESSQAPHGLYLAMDGMDAAVTLIYRGQKIAVTPAEIMAALNQKES